MVTAEMYKNYLSSYGSNLAQVKKNQSDVIMNNSFTADAQYKRVYILTKDGWKWEDAKYQRHADRKSTRLNSSHSGQSRMPSSA